MTVHDKKARNTQYGECFYEREKPHPKAWQKNRHSQTSFLYR